MQENERLGQQLFAQEEELSQTGEITADAGQEEQSANSVKKDKMSWEEI